MKYKYHLCVIYIYIYIYIYNIYILYIYLHMCMLYIIYAYIHIYTSFIYILFTYADILKHMCRTFKLFTEEKRKLQNVSKYGGAKKPGMLGFFVCFFCFCTQGLLRCCTFPFSSLIIAKF